MWELREIKGMTFACRERKLWEFGGRRRRRRRRSFECNSL
jgi:hypothetical protein